MIRSPSPPKKAEKGSFIYFHFKETRCRLKSNVEPQPKKYSSYGLGSYSLAVIRAVQTEGKKTNSQLLQETQSNRKEDWTHSQIFKRKSRERDEHQSDNEITKEFL